MIRQLDTMPSDKRQHIQTLMQLGEGRDAFPETQRDVIRRSWQRCLEEYQLDPSRPRPVRVLTQQALRDHQESADELLHVARAGVERLYSQIAQHGYALILTDQRGIAVDFRGQRDQLSELRRAGLYLGSDWNERYAGTSAAGTCLHDGAAVTCHQREHFDATHIDLTCTAAPITDPQGRVIAALDISALKSPRPQESQTFALSLVTLHARMIEDAYFLHRYRDCLILRFDTAREFVHLNGRGLFAIQEDGKVIAANHEGRRLIDAHLERWPPWTVSTLPAVTQLFDGELNELLSIPHTSRDQIRAFRLRADDATVFVTLIEPRGYPVKAIPTVSQQDDPVPELDQLAGDDPSMHRLLKLARRMRHESVSILIRGETGTGKEVLARALHDSGPRAKASFVAVNCAAIPESLIESELFGYLPGAFTGGRPKGMRGLIQQADGGTLFLDEIGDMPLPLQSRLLRVLAEREVSPLGAETPIKVDIRVITATHRDVPELIASGQFREDLYYRLNGAELLLPALRERADRHYLIRKLHAELQAERDQTLHLRADAISALLSHHWPGNIRQLRNAIAFAMATAEGDEITLHDLPEVCQTHTGSARGAASPLAAASLFASGASSNPASPALTSAGPDAGADADANKLLELLRHTDWNISQVARQLGVSRPTIYRRMRRHGLVAPNHQPLAS
ncbi:sigma-54-dependent Fis family transcriptional regulator [Cobetia sp.]|uniref:sigma-54-dependent Fis family transcriptional regulator n=2 Tax=Cobetia sp. TaxID=1873876 RepID=UPI00257EC89B|nr:sigma-54-dependent Fis family transcriptional regulator [Cobetia sp.]|tara:strand:- start:6118 stop:8169 length:2052 start_codon:yes stop_codon:yes gene_type:complete